MLWLKALHLIAVICWFAGIFYLPRLFVYHALATEQATRDHLKIMERKLYRFVTPFMLFTLVFGVAMIMLNPEYYLHAGWLHAKLVVVLAVIGYHHACGSMLRSFESGASRRSPRWFRVFNEVSVLLFTAAVVLVVVKPF